MHRRPARNVVRPILVSLSVFAPVATHATYADAQLGCTAANTYTVPTPLTISTNTMILTECLIVPNGARIRVEDGATLYVIARRDAKIGNNVTFDLKGKKGKTGPAGVGKDWPASHSQFDDAKKKDGCAAGNTQPGGANYDLVGKKGFKGYTGGQVRFALASASIGAGLKIDVNGGDGGDAGASAGLHCFCNEHGNRDSNKDGEIVDGPAPKQEDKGDPGDPGLVSIALLGDGSTALVDKMASAISPAVPAPFPPGKVLIHRQSYKPIERPSFSAVEIVPLMNAANLANYSKLPPP